MRKTKLFLILIFILFILNSSFAQLTGTYQIKGADTMQVLKPGGATEFQLENATDTVPGFLFNKGNGITVFKRGAVSLNDSTYIIGGDTIVIHSVPVTPTTISLYGDATGSGISSIPVTLATVNGNVGSFTNPTMTVNQKGLVTAIANGTSGSANTNIGVGYALAVTNTNNVKTIFVNAPIVIDSNSNTNALTFGFAVSANLAGSPTTTTQTLGTANTTIATTAFVNAAVVAATTGVSSFNTRTGAITLNSTDVTTALGFTPENVANKTATASSSTTTYPNWLGVENYVTGLGYQSALTLTTSGTSGAATLTGSTLNIPQYSGQIYTAGTGLSLTAGAFSVNTSQNIIDLTNLNSNGLIKTINANGTLAIATAGVDYSPATSGASILYGNGSGGFSNVTVGSGLSFSGGTLISTGSGGSVTNFSAGNSLPLFTTSVSTSTTTPALSFFPVSQTANFIFAAPNGLDGNPSFRAMVSADIPTNAALAGSPTTTTQTLGDSTTKIATTAFVQSAIDADSYWAYGTQAGLGSNYLSPINNAYNLGLLGTSYFEGNMGIGISPNSANTLTIGGSQSLTGNVINDNWVTNNNNAVNENITSYADNTTNGVFSGNLVSNIEVSTGSAYNSSLITGFNSHLFFNASNTLGKLVAYSGDINNISTISANQVAEAVMYQAGGTFGSGITGTKAIKKLVGFLNIPSDTTGIGTGQLYGFFDSCKSCKDEFDGQVSIPYAATGTAGTDSLLVKENGVLKAISPTYYGVGSPSTLNIGYGLLGTSYNPSSSSTTIIADTTAIASKNWVLNTQGVEFVVTGTSFTSNQYTNTAFAGRKPYSVFLNNINKNLNFGLTSDYDTLSGGGLVMNFQVNSLDTFYVTYPGISPVSSVSAVTSVGATNNSGQTWTITGSTSTVNLSLALTSTAVGLNNVQNLDQTNATNITSGTLSAARLPTTVVQNNSATNLNGNILQGAGLAVNTQSGTTYTLSNADEGTVIEFTNSSAITVTVPSGLAANFNCMVEQYGAGAVTLSPSSTTLHALNNSLTTGGQYGHLIIHYDATNIYSIAGQQL